MSIGENIRKIREKKNISQSELAEGCGVTQAAISKIESNLRIVSFPLATSIARYLDVPLDDLNA